MDDTGHIGNYTSSLKPNTHSGHVFTEDDSAQHYTFSPEHLERVLRVHAYLTEHEHSISIHTVSKALAQCGL